MKAINPILDATEKFTQAKLPGMVTGVALDIKKSKVIAMIAFKDHIEDDERKSCYLYEIQVHPDYRNQKLGQEMMSIYLRIADESDYDCCMLTVLTKNDKAIKFYTKNGFNVDEFTPDVGDAKDHGEEVDYLIMSRRCQRDHK